jgi:hypothetical protein
MTGDSLRQGDEGAEPPPWIRHAEQPTKQLTTDVQPARTPVGSGDVRYWNCLNACRRRTGSNVASGIR